MRGSASCVLSVLAMSREDKDRRIGEARKYTLLVFGIVSCAALGRAWADPARSWHPGRRLLSRHGNRTKVSVREGLIYPAF
jgi:hypothetical protein